MLTPKQVRGYSFPSAGRNAYKSLEVDEFMEEVCASYEQMFRENAELVKRIGMLADKIAEYKSDEDNIRNALLTAERMKDSIIAEAQEKVQAAKDAVDEKTNEIIDEANRNADRIISEANSRAEETLKLAQSNATKLLAKAQEIYDEQVNSIKEEAEKEREYLMRVKEESAKVRASLIESYQTQMKLLEYTPDFSAEVAAMHAKNKSIETEVPLENIILNEETPEEDESPVEEIALEETVVTEEPVYEEPVTDEVEELPVLEEETPEIFEEPIAEEVFEELEQSLDEASEDEEASIDEYLSNDDEFEDIDSGIDLLAEDDGIEEAASDYAYDPGDLDLDLEVEADEEDLENEEDSFDEDLKLF